MGEVKVSCDDLTTETKWDGSYEFNTKPGEHEVTVEAKGYLKQTRKVKTSRKDPTMNLDFDLAEERGAGRISGHVFDAQTKLPIKDGHMSLVLPNGNKYAELGSDGHYEFTGLAADTYEIWAAATSGYVNQQAKVPLKQGETKSLDFYLETAPSTTSQ